VGVQWSAPLAYSAQTRGFDEAIHQPWASPPFDLLPKTPRQVGSGDVVHRTVVERYQKDGKYRPEALNAVGGGIATRRGEDGRMGSVGVQPTSTGKWASRTPPRAHGVEIHTQPVDTCR